MSTTHRCPSVPLWLARLALTVSGSPQNMAKLSSRGGIQLIIITLPSVPFASAWGRHFSGLAPSFVRSPILQTPADVCTRHGSRQGKVAANSADNPRLHGAHVLAEEMHAIQNQQANPAICSKRIVYGEKPTGPGDGSARGGDCN